MSSIFGLGATVGTYAERQAIVSPQPGQLFYQTDTDEYLKYATDTDGVARWMMAENNPGRNLVVNGGFDVWQRATIATTSTADYYGPADRWQTTRLSSDTQRTFSRQSVTNSDTPVSGFTYFMRCQRDASTVATNSIQMATSFETTSVRRTQNKYVTLSFFARAGANYSAASGFLRAYITTGTGTDGRLITGNFTSPTTLVDSNNVLTTSWKRFTITTSAAVANTVTQMGINFQFTPTGTAGAADYYDITGVQLEPGTAPSDFEFCDFGEELRRCQRYYEKSYGYSVDPGTGFSGPGLVSNYGIADSVNTSRAAIWLKTPKRNNSYTVSFWSVDGTANVWSYSRSGAAGNATPSVVSNSENYFAVSLNVGAVTWVPVTISGHWVCAAEL